MALIYGWILRVFQLMVFRFTVRWWLILREKTGWGFQWGYPNSWMVYKGLVGGLEHQFYFPIYWECHHPNWLSYFFRGVAQPPTRLCYISHGSWMESLPTFAQQKITQQHVGEYTSTMVSISKSTRAAKIASPAKQRAGDRCQTQSYADVEWCRYTQMIRDMSLMISDIWNLTWYLISINTNYITICGYTIHNIYIYMYIYIV